MHELKMQKLPHVYGIKFYEEYIYDIKEWFNWEIKKYEYFYNSLDLFAYTIDNELYKYSDYTRDIVRIYTENIIKSVIIQICCVDIM